MVGIVNPGHTVPGVTMATAHRDVTLEIVPQKATSMPVTVHLDATLTTETVHPDVTLAAVTVRLDVISEEASGGTLHQSLMALELEKIKSSLLITKRKGFMTHPCVYCITPHASRLFPLITHSLVSLSGYRSVISF